MKPVILFVMVDTSALAVATEDSFQVKTWAQLSSREVSDWGSVGVGHRPFFGNRADRLAGRKSQVFAFFVRWTTGGHFAPLQRCFGWAA